jgi:hypothetical protein
MWYTTRTTAAPMVTTFSHADVSPVPKSRDRGAPAHSRDAE